MKAISAGLIAAAAIAVLAGAAKAENVCQWTGHDWACGDGNIVTAHYSQAQGPNMVMTPISAPQMPPGQVVPNVYGVQQR